MILLLPDLRLSLKRGYFQLYKAPSTLPFCCYHQHFHYIYSESVSVMLGGTQYKLKKGEMFYAPPGMSVDFILKELPVSTGMICMDFAVDVKVEYDFCDPEKFNPSIQVEKEFIFNGNKSIPRIIKSGNDEKLREIVDVICSFDLRDENAFCTQMSWLYMFIAKIINYSDKPGRHRQHSSRTSRYNEIIDKANMFIEENFGNPSLTLAQIAAASCNLNPIYFGHIYRQETGKPPIDNLIQRRVSNAQLLLRINRKMQIKEVAYESGFDNAKYFMKVFKAHTGHTPKQYRNAIV